MQFSQHFYDGLKLLFFTCSPGIIVACREVDLSLLHTVALRSWSPLILCLSALSIVPSCQHRERAHLSLFCQSSFIYLAPRTLRRERKARDSFQHAKGSNSGRTTQVDRMFLISGDCPPLRMQGPLPGLYLFSPYFLYFAPYSSSR